mgnify:CR=1 FL=1
MYDFHLPAHFFAPPEADCLKGAKQHANFSTTWTFEYHKNKARDRKKIIKCYLISLSKLFIFDHCERMPKTRAQLKRLGTENTRCITSHSSHTSDDSNHAKRKSPKKTSHTKAEASRVKRKNSASSTQATNRRTTRSKQTEPNTQEHVSKKQKLLSHNCVQIPWFQSHQS